MRRAFAVTSILPALVVACTTTREVHIPVSSTPGADASTTTGDDDDDVVEVVPSKDAGKDSGRGDASPSGLTPARKTTAVVTINGVKRTLERAQFGPDADGTFCTSKRTKAAIRRARIRPRLLRSAP